MSSTPLLAATLGFISAISRTILAIATAGLLDTATESTGGNGGGSGKKHGERPVDYSLHTAPKHQTADVAILAAACGII